MKKPKPPNYSPEVRGVRMAQECDDPVVSSPLGGHPELSRTFDALGTNLLTVQPGTSFIGDQATLLEEAPE